MSHTFYFLFLKNLKNLESEEKSRDTSMEEENVVRLELDEPHFLFFIFEKSEKLESEE